jgi:hypothetical protein
VVKGNKVSFKNTPVGVGGIDGVDEDDGTDGVDGVNGFGGVSGGAGSADSNRGGRLLSAATQLRTVVSLLEKAAGESNAASQHTWLTRAVETTLDSGLLDNKLVMLGPTGAACRTARMAFLEFMGTGKKSSSGSEAASFITTAKGLQKRSSESINFAVALLNAKLDELKETRRHGVGLVAGRAGSLGGGTQSLAPSAEEKKKDSTVYVQSSMEGAGLPFMGGSGPGQVMTVPAKKGSYVKFRGAEYGVFCDVKPGPAAVLVAVRGQIPLLLSGSSQIALHLLKFGYMFCNSFSGTPSMTLKEALAKGHIPKASVLLSGLESRENRSHLQGASAFAMAVEELSEYLKATYTAREVWTYGVRRVAADIKVKANTGDFDKDCLTTAWDATVVAVTKNAVAAVTALCSEYTAAERQVKLMVQQEESLVPDFFDEWAVQLRLETSVRESMRAMREEARRGEDRRDKMMATFLKQRSPVASPVKPTFVPKFQVRFGGQQRGGSGDRDRDRGRTDVKHGDRSSSSSRSRSRSPPPRRDREEGKASPFLHPPRDPRLPVEVKKRDQQVAEKKPCVFHWGQKGCRFTESTCRYSHDAKHKPAGK